MGICDSEGKVHDFQGPYSIGVDNMAFGEPTRYLQLDYRRIRNGSGLSGWDGAVKSASIEYSKRMHNLW